MVGVNFKIRVRVNYKVNVIQVMVKFSHNVRVRVIYDKLITRLGL